LYRSSRVVEILGFEVGGRELSEVAERQGWPKGGGGDLFQGDEDLWDFAKDAFRDKMKQEMTEAQANKVKARFRILVEPFYEQEEFEF
jgi:hypothetical protein